MAPKIDVIGPENKLFAGVFVHYSAWNYTRWGSDGVKSEQMSLRKTVTSSFLFTPCASRQPLMMVNSEQMLLWNTLWYTEL